MFEPVSIKTIQTRLNTCEIGRNLIYHNRVSSTMDVAADEVLRGAPHGTTVIAGMQEKGKGRLNRGWESPEGGVYLSIILYSSQELISSLMPPASLSVTDCIRAMCSIRAEIKWPNDVLINGKKVSGILARTGDSSAKGCYAVVGIGINANMDLSLQPEIAAIATSLSDEIGKPVSREAVICSLLQNFEKRFLALKLGEPQWQEWRERLVTLGKRISVKSGNAVFQGLAEAVTPKGNLMLRQEDGKLKEIPSGDVTLRL